MGDVTNLVPPVKTALQCSKHTDKQLDLFCETCDEMICRDCIIRIHRHHKYDLSTNAFSTHKDVIVASLLPVEQQLASVNKALDTECGQITHLRQTLETEIKRNIRQIHKALEAREEELLTHLDQMTQQKMKSRATQRDQLELMTKRLKSCHDFVQETLKTGSQGKILASKKIVMQQVKEMTTNLQRESFVPKSSMLFAHSQKELTRACQQFGKVYTCSAFPDKCHAEGKGLHIAVLGETSTATVHLVDQEGRECSDPMAVTCELVSRDGSSQVRGEVKKVGVNKYEISYEPQHSGQHQLHIRVEDVNIARSPFTVSAFTTTPTNTIAGLTWGVVVNDRGQIIVTNHDECSISIFNANGGKAMSFGSRGSGQMINPTGVALTATGDILVCDHRNHRIQLYSPTWTMAKCVGTQGSGHLQFNLPICIAVHPHSNVVYVTELKNHRVQILNFDLTFSDTFGSKGSGNGQFNCPRGVAFDSTGNVYVADRYNHRVQVFTARGKYIRQLGMKGDGEGELEEPLGIAIDSSDIVYISERGNHRISLFTRDGHFLRSFGTPGNGPGQFNGLGDIAVGKDGKIITTERHNRKIQIF